MNEIKQKDSRLLAKHKRKFIGIAAATAALFLAVLALYFKGYMSSAAKYKGLIKELELENSRLSDPIVGYEIASREVSLSLIESKIQGIGELATAEYLYTDVGKFEDPIKLFGKEVPFFFTTKSFIAKWDGVIKAGIRVEEITVEVNHSNKEIIVHLPEAEILDHNIDDDSIETLNEKSGLFNPIKVDDVRNFDSVSKKAMEQRAIENGILDKAYESAKETIYRLVYTSAVEKAGYTITFK